MSNDFENNNEEIKDSMEEHEAKKMENKSDENETNTENAFFDDDFKDDEYDESETDIDETQNEEQNSAFRDELEKVQEQISDLKKDTCDVRGYLDKAKQDYQCELAAAKEEINKYACASEKKIDIAKNELSDKISIAINECKEKNRIDLESLKNELKENLDKQTGKQVEMVGIFSSVVALLVINVNIVRSADTFLKAALLMSGLSCIVIIFAYLIHFFFNGNQNVKIGKGLTAAVVILVILTAVGLGTEFKIGEALKNISSSEKDNVSVEAKFEQNFSDHSDRNVVIREFDITPKDSVVKVLKNADGKKKDPKTEPSGKNDTMQENRK